MITCTHLSTRARTGYKQHAWGYDELHPISKKGYNWLGLGLTIIDSLDVLWVTSMDREFREAEQFVESLVMTGENATVGLVGVNLFEATIRVLGGLLSTWQLSGRPIFLEKAYELGSCLASAFDTDSAIPLTDVDLTTCKAFVPKSNRKRNTWMAEIGTLQLEFKTLALEVKNPALAQKVNDVMMAIGNARSSLGGELGASGLVPQGADNSLMLSTGGDSVCVYVCAHVLGICQVRMCDLVDWIGPGDQGQKFSPCGWRR